MSFIEIGSYGRIEVGDNIQCYPEGSHYYPILNAQMQFTCHPIEREGTVIPYKLIEIMGELRIDTETVSVSHVNYLFTAVQGKTFSIPIILKFPMDTVRIRRIEEIRQGKDIAFELRMTGLVFLPGSSITSIEHLVELRGSSPIRMIVPQSHWVKNIISKWNYGQVKLVEIYFPENYEHKLLMESYEHIERAISHFNNGNDRETLASVYAAFESMARSFGCENPDQNFFAKFLEKIENDKRERLKLLLHYFCQYQHLGRHTPLVSIDHRDSEFALTMAQLIYSYLSKIIPQKEK